MSAHPAPPSAKPAPRAAKRERLLPLLIELQRTLDAEIDLDSLASRFGASPFHFHRLFADSVGETPKKHVDRLRIERAAFMVAVGDRSLLDIALAVGFKNPETFSRSFKKLTGHSPSGYRRMARAAQAERLRNVDFFASDEYRLTRARFVSLPRGHLLAMRHMGAYGPLNDSFGDDDNPWTRLLARAQAAHLPVSSTLVGLFYDDPTLTPPDLQRSDVCVVLQRPVEDEDSLRCIPFDGGMYAIASYVGRIDTILSAFRGVADEIRRSDAYTFRDGTPLEFLRAPNVDGRAGVHRIDVGFPVGKLAKRGARSQESSRPSRVTRSRLSSR